MTILLLILLIYSCLKWFYYRALSIGLMYFARLEHNWDIDKEELKKIAEYSMKRIINDFFKAN